MKQLAKNSRTGQLHAFDSSLVYILTISSTTVLPKQSQPTKKAKSISRQSLTSVLVNNLKAHSSFGRIGKMVHVLIPKLLLVANVTQRHGRALQSWRTKPLVSEKFCQLAELTISTGKKLAVSDWPWGTINTFL